MKKIFKNGLNKKVRNSLFLSIFAFLIVVSCTFAWFSTNVSVVDGKLTLGTLAMKATVYSSDGETPVFALKSDDEEASDGNLATSETSGIVSMSSIQNLSVGYRYIEVENTGTINFYPVITLKTDMEDSGLSDYDLGYFFVKVDDISEDVSEASLTGSLKKYAATQSTSFTEEEAQKFVEDAYTLQEINQTAILMGEDETDCLTKNEHRYYKVTVLAYGLTSELLEDMTGDSIDVDATIIARQESSPFIEEDEGVKTEISTVDAFITAVRTASNGDTIVLTSDVNIIAETNISIYHRVNIDLNGYDLTINGNLKYDYANNGKCYLTVKRGSNLVVKGDFVIDTPNATFQIDGDTSGTITVGTSDKVTSFEVDCIRDDNDSTLGYVQNNISILDGNGIIRNMSVDSNTRVRISNGSKIGIISAVNNAYNIAVYNLGSISYIDFRNMGYWKLEQPKQLYVQNAGSFTTDTYAVILPSWSRGETSSLDPTSGSTGYQVNATLVRMAGAVTNDWTCAVYTNGNYYSAADRSTYVLNHSSDATLAAGINFWNIDIQDEEQSTTKVTRVAMGNYIIRFYDDETTQDSIESLLTEFYKLPVNSSFNGETITNLTLRTYSNATVDSADFEFIKNGGTTGIPISLISLDLESARIENDTIPDNALANCSRLANLTLPRSNITIGKNAFSGCNIEEITLDSNVIKVGADAFQRQGGLNCYITWSPSSQIPKDVLDGLGLSDGSTYVRLFMNADLISSIDSVTTVGVIGENKWSCYTYEKYDFIDEGTMTFIQILNSTYCKIVYYDNDYNSKNYNSDMIQDTYTSGRKYKTYAIGRNAYRLIVGDNSDAIALVFPSTLKEIGAYAFYKASSSGISISKLALGNVESIGDYAFYYAFINYSEARPDSFEGMSLLGDYCFGNATICPVSETASFTLSYIQGFYGDSDNKGTYPAGSFDLSAKSSAQLTLSTSLSNCQLYGVEIALQNYSSIAERALKGSNFNAVKLLLNGCNTIGQLALDGAFKESFKLYNELEFYNIANIQPNYALHNNYINKMYIGITDEQYTSQEQVDAAFSWSAEYETYVSTIFGGTASSAIVANAIDNLDISGYLPSYDEGISLFTFLTIENVNIHDLKSTIPDWFMAAVNIGNIEIYADGPLYVGDYAFYSDYKTSGASYNYQIDKFAIYNKEGDGWTITNNFSHLGTSAFEKNLKTSTCFNGVPFNLKECTYIGDRALNSCYYVLGDDVVLSTSLTTIGELAFGESNMITLTANGVTYLPYSSGSAIEGCNNLVKLEMRKLTSLAFLCSDSQHSLRYIIAGSVTEWSESSDVAIFAGYTTNHKYSIIVEASFSDDIKTIRDTQDGYFPNFVESSLKDTTYIYAYDQDSEARRQQFTVADVLLPQYILQKNDDGTYRIKSMLSPYWANEEVAAKNYEKANFTAFDSNPTLVAYNNYEVPNVLYDKNGNTYNISGVDYWGTCSSAFTGKLTFDSNIKTFCYSDTYTKLVTTTGNFLSDSTIKNITELTFEYGGTYDSPKTEGGRLTFGTYAFYNTTFTNLEAFSLSYADISNNALYSPSFPAVTKIEYNDVITDAENSEYLSLAKLESVKLKKYSGNFVTTSKLDLSNLSKLEMYNCSCSGYYIFGNSSSSGLKTLIVEDSTVDRIGNTSSNFFINCEKISISNSSINQTIGGGKDNLTSLSITSSSAVTLNGNMQVLESATFSDSTISITGLMNALKTLAFTNCIIKATSINTPSVETITLDGCDLSSSTSALSFSSKTMTKLKSIKIGNCTFYAMDSNGGGQSIFSSLFASECTSVEIKNCTKVDGGCFSDMTISSSATITLAGNNYQYYKNNKANTSSNRCKLNIEKGTLDISGENSVRAGIFYGTIGQVIYPSNNEATLAEYAVADDSLSPFGSNTNIGELVIPAGGSLANYINISNAKIHKLTFAKAITSVPFAFAESCKIDDISWASDQSTEEDSIAFAYADSSLTNGTPVSCWRTDFSDMDDKVFRDLFYKMDTSAFSVFQRCTFPSNCDELKGSDFDKGGAFAPKCSYQFFRVNFGGVQEIDLTNTEGLAYGFQNSEFPSLTSLKIGKVSGSYLFSSCKFPKLKNIDCSNIDSKDIPFLSCYSQFDSLEEITIDGNMGVSAFYYAKMPELKKITINSGNGSGQFFGADLSNVKEIVFNSSSIPSGCFKSSSLPLVTMLDLEDINVGDSAFWGCNLCAVTEIKTNEKTTFANNSFRECNLTSLLDQTFYINELTYFTFQGVKVGEKAEWTFANATKIWDKDFSGISTGSLSLYFPSLTTINRANTFCEAFSNSPAITYIEFGENFDTLGKNRDKSSYIYDLFANSSMTVYFKYKGVVALGTNLTDVSTVSFLVPSDYYDAYQEHAYWGTVNSQIYSDDSYTSEYIYQMYESSDDGVYEVELMSYLGNDTNIVIPENITDGSQVFKVSAVSKYLISGNKKTNATSIAIPASVLSVDNYLFEGSGISQVSIYYTTEPTYLNYKTENAFQQDETDSKYYSTGNLLITSDNVLSYVMPGASFADNTVNLSSDIVAIGDCAFSGNESIKTVVMPNVKYLGGSSFDGSSITCLKFTSAKAPTLLGDALHIFKKEGVISNLFSRVFKATVYKSGVSIVVPGLDSDGTATDTYLTAYNNATFFNNYRKVISKDDTLQVYSEPAPVSYTLNASVADGCGAMGNISISSGSTTTVTATPNDGYQFIGWYNGEELYSAETEISYSGTENLTLKARFEVIAQEKVEAVENKEEANEEEKEETEEENKEEPEEENAQEEEKEESEEENSEEKEKEESES